MKKVAIIGAGASGILCAIFCAKASCRVEIFEQNDKCAKKILVSGNGRCNITNKNLSSKDYFSDNPSFVEAEIQNLLGKGIVSKVHSKPYIVNHLTVAYNRKGKTRLILNCR